VSRVADRQGVTIYPFALPSGDPKRCRYRRRTSSAFTPPRARVAVAGGSHGGRLNEINQLQYMAQLYREVAANLRTLYTSPTSRRASAAWQVARDQGGSAHSDLTARTKPGYFARESRILHIRAEL
jgi:hypothetical protein